MFIDLVLCKHEGVDKVYLFRAPAFSYVGDDVIVETERGEQPAKVVETYSIDTDSKAYRFIVEAAGAYEPLKRVLKEVSYRTLKYEEEEHERADSEE